MIDISNSKAEEILIVLGDLRRMASPIPGARAANMRRRAKLIETYLTKKKNNYEKRNKKDNRTTE